MLTPGQMDDPQALQTLPPRHEAYVAEAVRLREVLKEDIHVLVAFEAEFIRPEYEAHVKTLASDPRIDYFVGSVHHVHSIPIDYDASMFVEALQAAGGSEEQLFEDYYDLQHQMLTALTPRVVGHFDLIRLFASDPGRDIRQWPGVWEKVQRNLRLAASQGAWLECNTAALRKGLAEPYPGRVIAQEWLNLGGKFTLSDDSHGIAHVATNYPKGIDYLISLGVENVWTMKKLHNGPLLDVPVSLAEIKKQFTQ